MCGYGVFDESALSNIRSTSILLSSDQVVTRAVLPRRSAATLADVVAHYNRVRSLGLTIEQQRDLVEYLKSL